MKRIIAGFVAGLVLATAGTGYAVTQASQTSQGSQNIHFRGIWCTTNSDTDSVACIPDNSRGYGIGISRDLVLVYNINTHRSSFQRAQP
jgi:hypothetical protein